MGSPQGKMHIRLIYSNAPLQNVPTRLLSFVNSHWETAFTIQQKQLQQPYLTQNTYKKCTHRTQLYNRCIYTTQDAHKYITKIYCSGTVCMHTWQDGRGCLKREKRNTGFEVTTDACRHCSSAAKVSNDIRSLLGAAAIINLLLTHYSFPIAVFSRSTCLHVVAYILISTTSDDKPTLTSC